MNAEIPPPEVQDEPAPPVTKKEKKARGLSPRHEYTEYDSAVAAELADIERAGKLDLLAPTLKKYHAGLSDFMYWYLLGVCFTRNPDPNQLDLYSMLFLSNRPGRDQSIMKPEEFKRFMALPNLVTVYRPWTERQFLFLSFSLELEVAYAHARAAGVKEVAEFTVPKADLVALLERRGGRQVIVVKQDEMEIVDIHVVPEELH